MRQSPRINNKRMAPAYIGPQKSRHDVWRLDSGQLLQSCKSAIVKEKLALLTKLKQQKLALHGNAVTAATEDSAYYPGKSIGRSLSYSPTADALWKTLARFESYKAQRSSSKNCRERLNAMLRNKHSYEELDKIVLEYIVSRCVATLQLQSSCEGLSSDASSSVYDEVEFLH